MFAAGVALGGKMNAVPEATNSDMVTELAKLSLDLRTEVVHHLLGEVELADLCGCERRR